MLRNLRHGTGPHRRLARSIDAAVPLSRLVPHRAQPDTVVTSVACPNLDVVFSFDARMAALHAHVKGKEEAAREAASSR